MADMVMAIMVMAIMDTAGMDMADNGTADNGTADNGMAGMVIIRMGPILTDLVLTRMAPGLSTAQEATHMVPVPGYIR